MELQHLNVKLFVEGNLPVDPARFIEVFHQWIRDQVLDELLIDVADYRHVPAGPGVMLIAHHANYSMDHTGGRCGLLYSRKAALDGSNRDRLGQAVRQAGLAAHLLEDHFGSAGLRFGRRELELAVNDRALAPNTPDTLRACRPELEAFFSEWLGGDQFQIDHGGDPRRRFSVRVTTAAPFDLQAL